MAKYKEKVETQTTVSYLTPNEFWIGMDDYRFEVDEAEMVEVGNSRVSKKKGRKLFQDVTDANEDTEFPIINENTGDVIGTMTYADLRHALYGLYIHMAERH